jgi:uncharacterized membrane protein
MFPCLGFGFGYWWIFPIIALGMMALCFFMMRGHMHSMMCRPGNAQKDRHDEESEAKPWTFCKRRARGEVDSKEYQEKKE